MGKLNVMKVKAATQPGRYQDGDGLMLLVKPSGARSWVLRLQVAGKRKDFGLGALKDVSLADARKKATEYRQQYREGIDPALAVKQQRAASATIPTFREAAIACFEEQKSSWRNAKHRAQWLSSLEAYAFPALGDYRIDQIDAPLMRDAIIPIWLEKPETARRVKQRIGTVLDWGHANGFRITEAPMRAVGKGLPKQPRKENHFAALPYLEVLSSP